MIDDEEKFDKTKYFLGPNKEKIYAIKGQNHKGLAYNILDKIGLAMLYYRKYENFIPSAVFLTYCGYVLVDEGEEKIDLGFLESKVTKYTSVGYCSAAIDEEYVQYLRRTYGNKENILDDIYQTDNIREKTRIVEVIKTIKERQKENQREEERE